MKSLTLKTTAYIVLVYTSFRSTASRSKKLAMSVYSFVTQPQQINISLLSLLPRLGRLEKTPFFGEKP